jgi:hypothetical protein
MRALFRPAWGISRGAIGRVLAPFSSICYRPAMSDEKLTPADPNDLATGLAFALKFEGRKRWHDADALMADIVAERLVRYLERAGYVVMKRPPVLGGGDNPGRRGFEG